MVDPAIGDEERWKKYVADSLIEISISKDILMLTRVDKPASMKRLFEIGCVYSGQILAYTKIIRQLLEAGNTTTIVQSEISGTQHGIPWQEFLQMAPESLF